MAISNEKLLEIKKYIEQNYEPQSFEAPRLSKRMASDISASYGLYDDVNALKHRVAKNLDDTWQQALFDIIDQKFLDEVEVYKRGGITKQTFSKIRSDADYHPDKDTAIRLCIGLKLNLDETLDLLGKAGYTLSKSIERDLVVRYFIEKKEYDIYEIDCVFEDMGLKTFLKY